MNCIFCAILEGKIPANRVYEDDHLLGFMDIHPGTKGHCLLIPKTHVENIYEIADEELKRIAPVLKKLSIACKEALDADGINIVQSNDAAAFQSVFHIHFHIIPRYEGDNIRLPWTPKPEAPDALEATAELIRKKL